jgi:hypothetical protein
VAVRVIVPYRSDGVGAQAAQASFAATRLDYYILPFPCQRLLLPLFAVLPMLRPCSGSFRKR